MQGKAESFGLVFDIAAAQQSVCQSQRWVLCAMQRYGQELVTMLWRILGNEDDVCDAYQTTFLKLTHCDGRQKPRHIKAYLFRSCANVAVSMIRQRITDRKAQQKIACEISRGDGGLADADLGGLKEKLRMNIARLPENLRAIVVLHDIGELSYREAGAMLGISAGTARVYRCKAVNLLSKLMDRDKEE